MTTKKTKLKSVKFEWQDLDRELTLREKLSLARPEQQIEILTPLVQEYRCEKGGSYGILEAMTALELLKNGTGSRENFDFIIIQMENAIEQRQFEMNEEAAKPRLDRDADRQKGCSTGGINSGISRREDAEERHYKIISRAKVLLSSGYERRSIPSILAESLGFSDHHIRKVLKGKY